MAEEKKMDVDEKVEEGAGKEESSGSAMRFEIKKWNAVTMWSWDICADTCAICRNSLNEPSIEYQVRALLQLKAECFRSCANFTFVFFNTRRVLLLITRMGLA